MRVNEKELRNLVESTGGSEELFEGIMDIFKKIKLKSFTAKFMEKGQETVYFAYSKSSSTFAKAVFDNGKLVDTVRYNGMSEMESDIAILEADGYKVIKEAKVARFIKFFVRNFGRLMIVGGIGNFIGATIMATAAGLGIGAAVAMALPAVTVSVVAGWIFAKVAEKESALSRDYAGVARSMQESTDPSEEIRQLVRDQIRKQAEKALEKEEK